MKETTAVLLAGGFGTRIRELYPDLPKPMIPVAGRPFLEWVLRYWAGQGVRRFVVSLGHLAGVAEEYFAQRPDDGLEIHTVVETEPLGTGGAIRFAAEAVELSDPFFAANADSLIVADLAAARRMVAAEEMDGVVLGVPVADTSRYGSMAVDERGRLTGFREKRPGAGVINAGVYLFRRRMLERFPGKKPLSIETEVFPTLLESGALIGVCPVTAPFLDMGTPESLAQAEEFLRRNFHTNG